MFIRNIYYGSKILAVGHQNINSGLIIKRLASSSSFEMPKIDQQILKNKFYKHLFFSMDSEVSFNDIKDVFKDIYYNIPKLFDHLSNNGLIKATKDDAVDESMGQKISQTIISLPETSMGNTFYTKMFLPKRLEII